MYVITLFTQYICYLEVEIANADRNYFRICKLSIYRFRSLPSTQQLLVTSSRLRFQRFLISTKSLGLVTPTIFHCYTSCRLRAIKCVDIAQDKIAKTDMGTEQDLMK